MRCRIMTIVAACVFLAAQGPDPDAKKKLEGTWSVLSLESEVKKVPDKDIKGMKMIFQGDRLTIRQGKKILGSGKFKIDLTRTPHTIDYREGPDITSPYDVGIVHIEGTTMKYCTTADPKKRPKEFDSRQGWLFLLKKDKSK